MSVRKGLRGVSRYLVYTGFLSMVILVASIAQSGAAFAAPIQFVINPSPIPEITESGSPQVFYVSLDDDINDTYCDPALITFIPTSQYTISPSSLTFDCTNEYVPQQVTIQAVDNSIIDGQRTQPLRYTLDGDNIGPVFASTPRVDELAFDNVIINDDDTGVIVTPLPSLAEGGVTQNYDIKLSKDPGFGNTVTINLSPDAQVALGVTSICFESTISISYSVSILDSLLPKAYAATCTPWNQAQTIPVSAVDDSVVEGSHVGKVTYAVSDTGGVYSEISMPDSSFTIADNDTATTPPADTDPISDIIEDAAPNNGDANGDGTLDSDQPLVASAVNPANDQYETLEVTGCPTAIIDTYGFQTESDQPRLDQDFDYPLGLKHLKVTGCSAATFNFYLSYDSGVTLENLRKFGPASVGATPSYFVLNDVIPVTMSKVSIGGRQVTKFSFSISDNGIGDSNTASNVIEDPIGPAFPADTQGHSNSCDQKEPKTPKVISLNRKGSSATLTFSSALHAERYQVAYSTNESALGGKKVNVKEKKQENGAIIYSVSNLDPHKTYYFKVRSDNGCNEGEWTKPYVVKAGVTPGLPSTGRGE